jgi:hypothetical protein
MLCAWLVAVSLVLSAIYLGWRVRTTQAAAPGPQTNDPTTLPIFTPDPQSVEVGLPALLALPDMRSISRQASMHTIIPSRPRQEALLYTVSTGDSVFGIAEKYSIEPETVLWANYDQLNDNPDMLSPGMELNIPPVNGVYYQWAEGIRSKASLRVQGDANDILSWPGNQVDLTNQLHGGPMDHGPWRRARIPPMAGAYHCPRRFWRQRICARAGRLLR